MSNPLSVVCEVWVAREMKRLAPKMVVQLLHIKPKAGQVLAGVQLATGQMCWPAWHYHLAVFAGGLVRDELYPQGIPMGEYKQKFEHADSIDFDLHPSRIWLPADLKRLLRNPDHS
jgi:hypothetical protein